MAFAPTIITRKIGKYSLEYPATRLIDSILGMTMQNIIGKTKSNAFADASLMSFLLVFISRKMVAEFSEKEKMLVAIVKHWRGVMYPSCSMIEN